MPVKILAKENQKTESWLGGTTTQLAIYPANSTYEGRNFSFRISTATVDVDHSKFTRLPGISRTILILDGVLKIEHKNRYSKILKKFETDSFQGDWESKGYGKVRDFNLMTTGRDGGSLKGMILQDGEHYQIEKSDQKVILGIYCFTGKLIVSAENETYTMADGNFLLTDQDNSFARYDIRAVGKSEIVLAEVQLQG